MGEIRAGGTEPILEHAKVGTVLVALGRCGHAERVGGEGVGNDAALHRDLHHFMLPLRCPQPLQHPSTQPAPTSGARRGLHLIAARSRPTWVLHRQKLLPRNSRLRAKKITDTPTARTGWGRGFNFLDRSGTPGACRRFRVGKVKTIRARPTGERATIARGFGGGRGWRLA